MPSSATEDSRDAAPAVQDDREAGSRIPLAASGMLIYAAVRVLTLAVAAFLLHYGRFRAIHWSLVHLVVSWDSGRFLYIAAHGYAPVPFFRHPESILASYPGYPLVIDTIAWIPGIGPGRAGFAVTIAAGLAAAWGLTRLGMALIGDRRLRRPRNLADPGRGRHGVSDAVAKSHSRARLHDFAIRLVGLDRANSLRLLSVCNA